MNVTDPVLEQIFTVRYSHVDSLRRMRLSALLGVMSETAMEAMEQLGCHEADMRAKGALWVIVKNYVRIGRIPELHETVTMQSRFTGPCRILFPRQFHIMINFCLQLLI